MFLMKRRIPTAIITLLMLSLMSIQIIEAEEQRAGPAPMDLQATARDSNIRLEWTEPSIGTLTLVNYFLYRSARNEETRRTTVDPWITSFSDGDVENGKEYRYYVTAMYNIGESGQSNYVDATPDGDPPFISINSPFEGSIYGSGIVTISWTGSDPTTTIRNYDIRIDDNSWIDVGLRTDHQFSDLSSGDHEIQVRATDTSLHRAIDSVNITIDDRPPLVVIRTPKDNEFITTKNLTITWDAYEPESEIVSYEVHLNGHYTGYQDNTTSYTIDSIKDGDHRIEVLAYDIVGNLGKDSINISVDTEGPYLSIIEPSSDITINDTWVDFRWEASDRSEITGFTIYWEDTGWTDIGPVNEITIGPIKEGPNEIILKAWDEAGWESIETRTVLVDLTPPELEIVHPDEGDRQPESKITVEWTASDELSGIKDFWIKLDDYEWARSRTHNYTIRGLSTGDHTASIKASDGAGNVRIVNVSFTVDNLEPEIIDYGPIGSSIPPPGELWIEFSEEMRDVSITVESVTGRMMVNDNRYVWKPDDPFAFGRDYMVLVMGEDLTGNTLEYFAWTFTVTDQVLVVGTVYNMDGDPLVEARIVMDSGITSLTDINGEYNLSAVMGNRTIHISKAGYITEEITITLVPGRVGYVGNVYLEKEGSNDKFRIPSALIDPWSYLVLALVLIALGLIGYLFKDQIGTLIEKIKGIQKNKIT